MSKTALPNQADPRKLAQQRAILTGELSIADMLRLCERLEGSQQGRVALIDLEFAIDAAGFYYIAGHVKAQLPLLCQRCMQRFDFRVDSDFTLSPVLDESELEQLPSDYEPIVVPNEGTVILSDLVEDELMLNLPLVPKHTMSQCKVKLASAETAAKQQGSKPFAVLSKLKNK